MRNTYKRILGAMVAIALVFTLMSNSHVAQAATQSGQVVIQYECDAAVDFDMELTLDYTAPMAVKPGDEFYIQTQTTSQPSETLANLLRLINAKYVEGDSLFTPTVENGEFIPGSLDIADRDWTPVKRAEIPDTGSFQTQVPGDGPGDLGPFVAEAGKDVVHIFAGTINTRLNLFEADGVTPPAIAESASNCTPKEDEDLLVVSITIDDEAPVLTLLGNNPMVIEEGEPYVEPGATAEDDIDGDLTDEIEITGKVDINTIGTYTVTYSVSDSAGNVATAERTVQVIAQPGTDEPPEKEPPSEENGEENGVDKKEPKGPDTKEDKTDKGKKGEGKGIPSVEDKSDGGKGAPISDGKTLPKTATIFPTFIFIGGLATIAGMLLLLLCYRRKNLDTSI